MPSRDDWWQRLERAQLLLPPLQPPASCRRCLQPLAPDKRRFRMCWECGHEHRRVPLPKISAVTYGAAGTEAWTFFTAAKFGRGTTKIVGTYTTAIAASLSLKIEQDHIDFVAGTADHVVVPTPSSSGLIVRCLAEIDANEWPPLVVMDALTAEERPKQIDLDKTERREAAAGKYRAAETVREKHVLLLDDAYTSGYTAHDAARALVEAGARSVGCVVYARRIYPDGMAIYRAELEEADGER